MIIEIKPLDTLVFRKGRSFNMGEDNWDSSVFPPSPSVVYGALRAVYLFHNEEQLKHAGTENDPTTDLIINGIYYLKDNNEILYPLPRDCVKIKDREKKEKREAVLLKLKRKGDDNKEFINSAPKNLSLLKHKEVVQGIKKGVFDTSSLSNYLEGMDINYNYETLDDYYSIESKTGIKIDPTTKTVLNKPEGEGSSVAGHLYHLDMIRLKGLRIVVEFENLDIPEEGLIKLGGQGKASSYKTVEKDSVLPKAGQIPNSFFKFYLLTPAKLNNGWLPSWINPETLKGEKDGIKLELITAAIGSPRSIGGYNIKEKKAKPTYDCVPEGSIYVFESNADEDKVKEVFHGKSISDYDAKEGFGIVFVGGVQD